MTLKRITLKASVMQTKNNILITGSYRFSESLREKSSSFLAPMKNGCLKCVIRTKVSMIESAPDHYMLSFILL